jgi:alpha,alpha-trehalose phosphorylase
LVKEYTGLNELEFTTKGYSDESLARDETLFHCANGYLGVRGCLEEGVKGGVRSVRGTYINGFYEQEEICYGERLYGFPDSKKGAGQPAGRESIIKIWAGGEPAAAWNDFRRGNDAAGWTFAAGIAKREYRQNTAHGTLIISAARLVSFVQKDLLCFG